MPNQPRRATAAYSCPQQTIGGNPQRAHPHSRRAQVGVSSLSVHATVHLEFLTRDRLPLLCCLVAFILTFFVTRIVVRYIRRNAGSAICGRSGNTSSR